MELKKQLEDRIFDMLEYESTVISPKYKERAIKLNKFKYLNVYLLSPEDIIVSKIIRLEQKDINDVVHYAISREDLMILM